MIEDKKHFENYQKAANILAANNAKLPPHLARCCPRHGEMPRFEYTLLIQFRCECGFIRQMPKSDAPPIATEMRKSVGTKD